MSFLEDDDTFSDLAEEEQRRKHRRGSSAPLIRFLLALAAVIVIVLVGGLLLRNWLSDREADQYRSYMQEVQGIARRSDAIGAELTSLLTEPGDSTRKDLQTKLDKDIQKSKALSDEAKQLEVPDELTEAQQWFAATLQLRSRGLEDLKPSLMSALEVKDVEVSAERVSRAMQFLVVSDFVYEEFFASRASSVLEEKGIEGLNVPSSRFVPDVQMAGRDNVQDLLATLREAGTLEAVHGVALSDVVAQPAEKKIEEGETYNLQMSEDLAFVVTVENQGNMEETDVPVTLTLHTPESPQPHIVTVKIPEIKPKEQKQVTLSGINPTDYGETAVLTVEAGPVPEEKILENNSLEAHVIFIF